MAVFNPQVPNTNDPNWLGWSKAISQPGADSSTGELLTTAGEGIKEGVKFAATAMDEGVKTIAYDATRKLQDEYTSSLEKADISIRVADAAGGTYPTGPGVPGGNATSRQSVYDAPPTDIAPQGELKRLPQDLAILDSARANGKLSNTAYEGRLVALAKDLRARYPGQRDHIDEEIYKVSQRDVANKYVTSLLGDINSFANAGKEEDKQVRAQIIKMNELGVPGAAEHMRNYLAGAYGPPDQALPRIMAVVAPAHQLELQLKLSEARRKERQGSRADLAIDEEADANKYMEGQAFNTYNSINLHAGQPTFEQMANAVKLHMAGVAPIDETQARVFAQNIKGLEAEAHKRSEEYFNQPGADGRPRRAILGEAKVNEIRTAHLKRFSDVSELLLNKQYGAAYNAIETTRALGDEAVKTLVTSEELGQTLLMGQAVDKLGLPQAGKAWFQEVISKEGNLDTKYREFIKNSTLKMSTQPRAAAGVISTLKENVDKLRARTNNAQTPALAKTYDGMLSAIETIADPKNTDLQSKSNLAKAAFDPKNIGLLTQFGEDSGGGNTGQPFKPGKFAIFQRLFSDDMTKAVQELKEPQVWAMYKDLAKQMGFRELYGPAITGLSQGPSAPMENKDVRMGWNSETAQFTRPMFFAGPINPAREKYKEYVNSTVDRLNFMFARVSNIAKEEGTDPNALILGWMKELGVDTGKLPGIPKQMLDEIIRANTEARETDKKRIKDYGGKPRVEPVPTSIISPGLPYNIEDAPSSGAVGPQGSSLSDFLANPGRVVAGMKQNAPATSAVRSRGILSQEQVNAGDEYGTAADKEMLRKKYGPDVSKWPYKRNRSMNLSDQDIVGIGVEAVPEGADINKYLRK